jgi:hypothetical protein
VALHEAVDAHAAPQDIFDIVGDDLAASEVVAKVVRALGELGDEMIDVVLRLRVVDRAVVQGPVETLAELIRSLLDSFQQLLDLFVVHASGRIPRERPALGNAIRSRELVQVAPQDVPITLGLNAQLVAGHEVADEQGTVEHVFDVRGTCFAIVDSIAQAIGGLCEVLQGLVDLIFRTGSVDRVSINRPIEAGAEGIGAFVDATQQIFHLLVVRAGG